jgi:hypothetical protein
MSRYFVVVTEQNTVFGLRDWFGLKIAWVFDDRSVAQSFIRDFRMHMSNKKVVSFRDPTETELEQLVNEELLYVYMNPEMQICLTEDNNFFPSIREDAVSHDNNPV